MFFSRQAGMTVAGQQKAKGQLLLYCCIFIVVFCCIVVFLYCWKPPTAFIEETGYKPIKQTNKQTLAFGWRVPQHQGAAVYEASLTGYAPGAESSKSNPGNGEVRFQPRTLTFL